MELILAIAALCQTPGNPNFQLACHKFYLQCVADKAKSNYPSELLKQCVLEREV